MGKARRRQSDIVEDILGRLARRYSTAAVLLHQAVAERLGLGASDLKCLDLLRERGALTGSELAAITGLTTGAITGVVANLERAGFVRRVSDRDDRRKQILTPMTDRVGDLHDVFAPLRRDVAAILEGFDHAQLAAVAEFLERGADAAYHHMTLLRGLGLRQTLQHQPAGRGVPRRPPPR